MSVVNKQAELLELVFDSVYFDLQYDEIYLTFTAGYVLLCGVCTHVVVFGTPNGVPKIQRFILDQRLSCYPMWVRWLL